MNSKLIYDLPTRLFHAIFALLFIAAFIIAKAVDDESVRYGFHMIFGMLMVCAVILRIFWGIVGSEYAKFKHFALNPKELVDYLKAALTAKTKKYIGHNPASSYAAIVMMLLSILLVATGYQMVMKIDKEVFEEVHEIFAHLFLIVSILHVVGIALHTIKHKDPIGLAMIHGKKTTNENTETINQHVLAGIVFVVIMISMGGYLISNYNLQNGELKVFGKNLVLIEVENEKD